MDSENTLRLPPECKRLRAIFDGNGAQMRTQFIFGSLILTIIVWFKVYVVGQVEGFFADHIEFQEGNLKYTRGVEFKKLIKERGVGDPGKHDNRVFRVAMHWFFKLGAIEKQELDAVERLYKLWGEVFL